MIGRVVDQYRIVRKLGQGGMGEVYLADDTTLGRRVALKFLSAGVASDEAALARFRREAQTAAALEHPGIMGVYHVGSFEGRPYIVMAFVDGRPLSALIAEGPLEGERIRAILLQVGDALSAAHRAGVIHRDIKPDNIVVGEDGRARILDFGLAKLHDTTALTSVNTVLGTAHYMSPEQVRGDDVDARSDIFSLGAVLYEMLTGRRAFDGEHREATFYSILNQTPETPLHPGDEAASALAPVAMQALAKKPEMRFASVDAMLAAVRGQGYAAPARPRRARAAWLLVAAFAIAAAAVYWITRPATDAPVRGEGAAPLIEQLSTSQVTFDPGIEQWPSWSPDGARVVYAGEVEGFRKIFARPESDGQSRPITHGAQDDIQPAWSPDGKVIAFVRARQPGGRLAPSDVAGFYYEGGDVFTVDVATGNTTKIVENAFNPSYSPNGAAIAFDAPWAGPRRIWQTDARGRNPRQLTTDASEAVAHVSPRWSPDGRHIVYRRVETTRADIEYVNLDSGSTVRLTTDAYNDADPVWSPDGRFIYFSSYRGGGLNIWRIPVEGDRPGPPQQITTGAGDDVQPALSPDGNRLAFSALGLNSDLWIVPLDPSSGRPSGAPRAVVATTREDSRGAWSPDGNYIAFNSDRSGDMNIWIRSLEDGGDRQLTRGAGGDYQSNWSPDARTIAFFSSRSGNADIWTADVATGELRRLTDYAGLDINPFFSPDGTRIAFQTDRGGRSELWVMGSDGSGQRRVVDVEASGHFMRWFADGRRVLFASGDGEDRVIYATGADDGSLQEMPKISSGAHMSFSPDQSLVLEVAGHRVLWIYPLDGDAPVKILEFDDPEIRIDYPVWSSDGTWAVFDRVSPRGGDVWVLEGLAR